jgi:hypothetical protein
VSSEHPLTGGWWLHSTVFWSWQRRGAMHRVRSGSTRFAYATRRSWSPSRVDNAAAQVATVHERVRHVLPVVDCEESLNLVKEDAQQLDLRLGAIRADLEPDFDVHQPSREDELGCHLHVLALVEHNMLHGPQLTRPTPASPAYLRSGLDEYRGGTPGGERRLTAGDLGRATRTVSGRTPIDAA